MAMATPPQEALEALVGDPEEAAAWHARCEAYAKLERRTAEDV